MLQWRLSVLLRLLPSVWLHCCVTLLLLDRICGRLPSAIAAALPAGPTCQVKAVCAMTKAAAVQRIRLHLPAASPASHH